jgi:hypothetical protein
VSGLSDEAIGWIAIAHDRSAHGMAAKLDAAANLSSTRSMENMVQVAEGELRRRKMRARFLPAELFGEGGWSMLLDLFVSEQHGRKVSVTSACIAADVPGTTALRWLDVLESKGLIVRTSAERDERVRYVSLTVEARRALCELLARQASEHR